MKLPKISFLFLAVCTIATLPVINVSAETVTLNVSPSVVGNNYNGLITINIGGLTNGQTVTVQTYLDLKSNGVVATGDPLVDDFNITDGGASVIGGVTNINVPFDSNPATGAITTSLSFAPQLENIVGQKIISVLSSPPGAFTPVTATLDVTNAALGQSVSGNVYYDSLLAVQYALVLALNATNQIYAGSTIANKSGHYSLSLNPGTYILLPGSPGYYADEAFAPIITLTNGTSPTCNLYMSNITTTISGRVYDAGNSNALGGVFLELHHAKVKSGDLLAEVAFTDTNGDYTADVTPEKWSVTIDPARLARRAYVAPQGNALTVDASSGNVTNANIGLYEGNALFYGQLIITNAPVPNFSIECNDSNQYFEGIGYTDTNGNYTVAAVVNTNVLGTNDVGCTCMPDPAECANGAILDSTLVNQAPLVELTNGQAYLQDFYPLPFTATISVHLANYSGALVSGVGVGATATINSYVYNVPYVDTDSNGNYSFGATSGQWDVGAKCCGSDSLDSQGYYDPASYHAVTIPPDNAILNITVLPASMPFLSQVERISPTQFGFNFSGTPGSNYTVQASINLSPPSWFIISNIYIFPGGSMFIEDNGASNRQEFYRAILEP